METMEKTYGRGQEKWRLNGVMENMIQQKKYEGLTNKDGGRMVMLHGKS